MPCAKKNATYIAVRSRNGATSQGPVGNFAN